MTGFQPSLDALCQSSGGSSLPRLLEDIQRRLARGERLILALDGQCAAGKTTLAQALGRHYGWSVIHMDHFFLRPEQRSSERYATPGENVDHERFLTEVLVPLRAGDPVTYRPFDCQAMGFAPSVSVEPSPVTVVEGSYSCHPSLWEYYDLRVFLTAAPERQLARIAARNGPEGLAAFQARWIPLEEAYFAACHLAQRCDYCLELLELP